MKLTRDLALPVFEKTAGKFMLGENPSTYASELIAHLYKQHSFLGRYDVSISIDGQDNRLGYMYGVFIVKSPKQVPPEQGQQRMDEVVRPPDQETEDVPSVRVPIIVENKKSYSFDVFINPDGRFMPLNEQRIASALFEAGPYSVAPHGSDTPESGQGMNFHPDAPEGALGGVGRAGQAGFGKVGSAIAKLSGAISANTVEDFLSKIAADQRLLDAATLNESFSKAIVKIADSVGAPEAAPSEPDDFDVATITKSPGGYRLKVASFDNPTPREFEVPNSYSEAFPLDVRQDVVDNGVALMVSGENSPLLDVENAKGLKTAEAPGIYSVISKTGSAQRAAVLTEVHSFGGRKLDMCIVVGPSGAAFQEKVAGIYCGDLDVASLSGDEPHGEGFFLFKEAGIVSEPVTIKNTIFENGETSYLYEHALKGAGVIKLASVNKPVQWERNGYLIPEDSVFVPLSFGHGYESDTVLMEKIASRHDLLNKVTIHSDGSNYTFSGPPVNGVEGTENLTKTASLLMLGLLGDTSSSAMKKLNDSNKNGSVSFVAERHVALSKVASAKNPKMTAIAESVQADLVKEASVLTGADTVDSVLSLNFVTPENVQGYVDTIPDLEQASFKLAELLVGVRLGLSDVPESAVSASLSGIERAIQGLKKLQIRSNVSV